MSESQAQAQLRQVLANDGGLHQMEGNNGAAPGFHQPYQRGDGYDILPGIDGLRYRQPTEATRSRGIPDIKGRGDNQLDVKFVAKCRTFDFTNDTDLLDYQNIMTDCANGLAKMGEHEKQFCEQTQNWKAWMRWYEIFLEDPKNDR